MDGTAIINAILYQFDFSFIIIHAQCIFIALARETRVVDLRSSSDVNCKAG